MKNQQNQATPVPAVPVQQVNARDLVREAAREERDQEITAARELQAQLKQAEDQLAQYDVAERVLKGRGKDLTSAQSAAREDLRILIAQLNTELKATDEDTRRIAQFRDVGQTLRVLSDKELHPETPSLQDYAEAVHGLLKVTDHAVVTQEELAGARERKQDGHFVFCDCRVHREISYTVSRQDSSQAEFRGTYFRFESYAKSPAVRSAVFFALRTRNRIRSAERKAAEERKNLLANATEVKAENILNLTCSGLVAVPVLFRDGKPAGQLVLEIADRTVTLKAATNRGMAAILKDCIGKSLTAVDRRGTGPDDYFFRGPTLLFKGPTLLYHIIAQSAREPASEEQVRQLAERFRPATAEPDALGPAHVESERERKPRGRRPKREPSLDEEELGAENEAVAEALGSNEDEAAKPQIYSAGPEDGASPFAALATLRATPQARRIADELGVDLGSITGTGQNGTITVSDVRNASAAGNPNP